MHFLKYSLGRIFFHAGQFGCFLRVLKMQEGLLLFGVVIHVRSCLYQKNNPTQVGETSHLYMRMDSYHTSEIPLIAHEISHKWHNFFSM